MSDNATCIHHWLLEPKIPDRPKTPAICKKCNIARTFDGGIHDVSSNRFAGRWIPTFSQTPRRKFASQAEEDDYSAESLA